MTTVTPASPHCRGRFSASIFRGGWLAWGSLALSLVVQPWRLAGADTTISGIIYRPLSDVAAAYGMKSSWTEPQKTMRLQNQYCTIDFTANERSLRLNDEPMALGFSIVPRGGILYVSKRDVDDNLFPLLSPGQIPSPTPVLHRIIIDPGHGGTDSGTSNPAIGTNEKTNTLDVGLRLAAELRKRGYEVILTRTKDVTFNRKERPVLANAAKGDLYLSIHFNEEQTGTVAGIETWIMAPPWQPSTPPWLQTIDKQVYPGNRFDDWNAILGFSVERTVARELNSPNRGVKRARLDVLLPLNMPGLLVECGFLSNKTEGNKIITPDYRQKIALALADGVDLYKATLDRLRPKVLAPPTPVAKASAATTVPAPSGPVPTNTMNQ